MGRRLQVLLFSAILVFCVKAELNAENKTLKNESSENMLKKVADMARLAADVPPYDPNNPVDPPPEVPMVENPTPPPQTDLNKPYYPYYPYYDEKWRKCCKLEKAKECCMAKAKDLPLYNLGTGVYYFHNDMSTAKNWYDALHFCRAHGMELVSIETASENSMLQMYVQWFLGGVSDFYSFFWTSLNDLGSEGIFTWAGTGQSASYTTWHLGAPNGGTSENCGEMWDNPVGNTLWNDRNCLQWKGRFICEMPKPCADIIYASYD